MSEHESPKRSDWRDLHLWQIQPIRDVLLILAVIGLFWLGERISLVTVPLLLAVLLAYLFEPVIGWLERRTMLNRRGIVAVLIGALTLLIAVSVTVGAAFGVAQAAAFLGSTAQRIEMVYQSARAPDDEELANRIADEAGHAWVWIRESVIKHADEGDIEAVIGMIVEQLRESAYALMGSTASTGVGALKSAAGILGAVFAQAFEIFLTGFFFFFVSTGWVKLKADAVRALPTRRRERIIDLVIKFDRVISGFVRGRLTIALAQAVFFTLAYWLIGVPAAFIVGPAIAVLAIVPYLSMVGIPVTIGLIWIESHTGWRGSWWWVLGAPTAVYFIGQALDDYVLTPLIQGKSTDMDTPTILFASLAGGALFGVFGLLIAIPIAACLKIVIVEVLWPRFKEWTEGRAKDPLPIENGV